MCLPTLSILEHQKKKELLTLIIFLFFNVNNSYAHDLTLAAAAQTIPLENSQNVTEKFQGTPYSVNLNINPLKKAFRSMTRLSYEKTSLKSSKGSNYNGATTRLGGGIGIYNLYFMGLIGIGQVEISKEKKSTDYKVTSGLLLTGWEYYLKSKVILRTEVQYEILSISGKKNDTFGEVYLGNNLRFSLGVGYAF